MFLFTDFHLQCKAIFNYCLSLTDKLYTTITGDPTFTKTENKYCSSRYPSSGFSTLEVAQFSCLGDDECKSVYDNSCDDSGTFYLCDQSSKEIVSGTGSCLYIKE